LIKSHGGHSTPGANPTIVSYNATGSLARFENKNIYSALKNAQAYQGSTTLTL
jgi:hypothetical protein